MVNILLVPTLGIVYLSENFFSHRNPAFGSMQFHWLSTGRDLCPSKVSVAADYSDSVPDSSSNQINSRGYHPLEEVKSPKRIRDTKLTPAEIARTTVEVCIISPSKQFTSVPVRL